MKKFVVISTGTDSEGPWAHQVGRGLFETPDAALAEFRKDWSKRIKFELYQLDTGTYQIRNEEDGRIDGLVVPLEI